MLLVFNKLYINKQKYSSKSDNFNYKKIIFINFYNKANILKVAYNLAYFNILKRLAFNYYYTNVKNNSYLIITFNIIYIIIYNYFKRLKYKRSVFNK